MSRSYRKSISTEGYGSKRRRLSKIAANRRVRKAQDIPNGRAYRKWYNPWDICDWKSFEWNPPVRDAISYGYGGVYRFSLGELLQDYRKRMRK